MKGVEIGTRLDDRELDAEDLEPFWCAAEELGALVFMHPSGTTLGRCVERYYLSNISGNSLDTTIALSHLVCGGVLERHPRLKLCAAHGGGYLPSYMLAGVTGLSDADRQRISSGNALRLLGMARD